MLKKKSNIKLNIAKILVLFFAIFILSANLFTEDLLPPFDIDKSLKSTFQKYSRTTGVLVAEDVSSHIPLDNGDFFIIHNLKDKTILSYYNFYQSKENELIEILFEDINNPFTIEYIDSIGEDTLIFAIREYLVNNTTLKKKREYRQIIIINKLTLQFKIINLENHFKDAKKDILPFAKKFYIGIIDPIYTKDAREFYTIELLNYELFPKSSICLTNLVPITEDKAYSSSSPSGKTNLIITVSNNKYSARLYDNEGYLLPYGKILQNEDEKIYIGDYPKIRWNNDDGFFYFSVKKNKRSFSWRYYSLEDEKSYPIIESSISIPDFNYLDGQYLYSINDFVTYGDYKDTKSKTPNTIPLYIAGYNSQIFYVEDKPFISYVSFGKLFASPIQKLIDFPVKKKKVFSIYAEEVKKILNGLLKSKLSDFEKSYYEYYLSKFTNLK